MKDGTLLSLLVLVAGAFAGSWHCGLMCGPVAVALGHSKKIWSYHCGRMTSYFSLGIVAGKVGQEILASVSEWRWMGLITLTLLLIATTVEGLRLPHLPLGNLFRLLRALRFEHFSFGLLSALLPCHRLWIFVLAAASTGSPWAGGMVMVALWLSSIPALSLAAAYFRSRLPLKQQSHTVWIQRVLVIAGIYSLWAHII